MPGVLHEWPAWPEFIDKHIVDHDCLNAKSEILAQYGEEAIRSGWLEACTALQSITAEIIAKGTSIIPILDMEEIAMDKISKEREAELKRVGCFVVRNVIPEEEAKTLYGTLKAYVEENQANITGWPVETPSMLNLFNSPAQVAVRTHPNHLQLQHRINQLWHDATEKTSPNPLLYFDLVRIRPPMQKFLGLGPHIDAGSLCRWADPAYRDTYARIFSGKPLEHDCYDLGKRQTADQCRFPGPGQATVFRSFQGWTALSRAAPREGSLLLYPNVQVVIAYLLLRPFFDPPATDVMDATKWSFNPDGAWFPGTFKEHSQYLSRSSHPHLRLEDCMIRIPVMKAGDTVWWHADVGSIPVRLKTSGLTLYSYATP
jgi:hypothetical protein